MSEFIVVGIIVILGVNGLYSRFCEGPRQFSRNQRHEMARRRAAGRL